MTIITYSSRQTDMEMHNAAHMSVAELHVDINYNECLWMQTSLFNGEFSFAKVKEAVWQGAEWAALENHHEKSLSKLVLFFFT